MILIFLDFVLVTQNFRYLNQNKNEGHVLWFEYFRSHERVESKRLIPWAIIAPIIFSGLIEIGQQLFVPTRVGDWEDFLFNALGCIAAVLFSQTITRRVLKR